MILLIANDKEFNTLNNYKKGEHLLTFVEDTYGRKVVNKNVINNPAFSEIKDELEKLQEIEYYPKEL